MAMKNSAFLTLASLALVCSCGTKQETPKSDTHIQQAASTAPSENPLSDDEIFKYTITSDHINVNDEDDHIEILVVIHSVDGQYPVKYDLDCEGDGDFEYKGLSDIQKCIYPNDSGTHQIWVRGEIPAMVLCDRRPENVDCKPEDKKHQLCDAPVGTDHSDYAVLSIDSWGNIPWKSMRLFAARCYALEQIPKESPDLRQVKDMHAMFWKAESFNLPIESWDVSNVTNMNAMFYGATLFNQPLNAWNVSHVTDMSEMFARSYSFNQPLDKWDVSNVTDMHSMFLYANKFNQPLESWNVSNVTNMSSMFTLAVSFNQPLEKWNVSNVTNMNSMFFGAKKFNQPLESWNVSKVTDMSEMFTLVESFNQPLENWDVSKVTDMSYMFSNATSFNQPLDAWDVSKVKNMDRMFYDATSFNQPLDKWNVSNVDSMRLMFNAAKSFSHYPKSWVVPVNDLAGMFHDTKVEEEANQSPLKTKKAQ